MIGRVRALCSCLCLGVSNLPPVGATRNYPSVRPCHACTLLPGMRHLTRLLHHPVSRPCSPRDPPSRPNCARRLGG